MSHTYNIECDECYEKFCECHPYIQLDVIEEKVDADTPKSMTFCDKTCRDNHLEHNHLDENDYDEYTNNEGII